MLTPEYLERQPAKLVKIFREMENEIIKDMSESIAKNLKLTEKSEYHLILLQEMGYDLREIEKEIEKVSKLSKAEVRKILTESSELSYDNDRMMYREGGKDLPPLEKNPKMKDFINTAVNSGVRDMDNLTKTIGMVDNGRFKDLDTFYRDKLNEAVFQLGSGVYDLNQVLEKTVRELADSGIRFIDYASGRSYHTDSAVRMNILTTLNQITGQMSEMNADMMDQDLMEITAHHGARPTHREWQGEIVSRSGDKNYLSLEDIGFGDADGFQGVNCRHNWYPYFEGISTKVYTKEHLDNLDWETEYNGKIYDTYEATQKQRYMERQMRETQRRIVGYEAAGLEDAKTAMEIKLSRQREAYKDFSNAVNIRPKWERIRIYDIIDPTTIKDRGIKSVREVFAKVRLDSIEKSFAEKIEERLVDLVNKYPIPGSIEESLNIITRKAKSYIGVFEHGFSVNSKNELYLKNNLVLSNHYLKDEAKASAVQLAELKGRKAKNYSSNPLWTVDHEYAHALDRGYAIHNNKDLQNILEKYQGTTKLLDLDRDDINAINLFNKESALSDNNLSNTIYKNMMNDLGISSSEMERRVLEEFGNYASTDVAEFFAEGFAAMIYVPDKDKTDFLKMFENNLNRLIRGD